MVIHHFVGKHFHVNSLLVGFKGQEVLVSITIAGKEVMGLSYLDCSVLSVYSVFNTDLIFTGLDIGSSLTVQQFNNFYRKCLANPL